MGTWWKPSDPRKLACAGSHVQVPKDRHGKVQCPRCTWYGVGLSVDWPLQAWARTPEHDVEPYQTGEMV